MSISFFEIFALSWAIVLGSFPKISSRVNWCYFKKEYSKVKVNVVEITQIRLHKIKKNAAMASFYCLVSKIWKTIVFYLVIRREKDAWFEWFLKRKKLT